MRNSLSLWLFSIIVLAILAFLTVFKPITFTPRKDPSDASRYLRPVSSGKDFDPERPPTQGTFAALGQSVYIYQPQHDLRLGLDLRGGMRVVLEIPDRAVFDYTLNKEKVPVDSMAENQMQDDLTNLLAATKIGPDAKDAQKVQVRVNGSTVEIVTQPKNTEEAKFQLTEINSAMDKLVGPGNYTAPTADAVFNPAKLASQRADVQKSVLSIMEQRLNKTGTTEVTAYAEGTNRVVLEIPGVKDPERVKDIIKSTAVLQFRILPDDITSSTDPGTGKESFSRFGKTMSDEDVIRASRLVFTGDELSPTSQPTYDEAHHPAVQFSIKPDKQQYFGAMTQANKKKRMAIVLDNAVVMAPEIESSITSTGIINSPSGNFTMEQVTDWATLLNAGALPVPVKIVETRTVSATLGADSISKSLYAGIIGLALVLIFMAAYYRLPGLMADLALVVYIVLSLAVLKLFDATLTLPGIAGLVISVGMAVDANVIIFERLKEELRTQKPLETSIDVAFQRAWTAILDSNVASLITGSVLYALGTGAVRGFAITLIIGVAVSLFTAVTVTRLFMKLMIRSRAAHKLAWYGL